MPPPELNIEKWLASVKRLRALGFPRIAPTHFGIFDDAAWHLQEMESVLGETVRWLEEAMRGDPDIEQLRTRFVTTTNEAGARGGLSAEAMRSFELANPLGMSADGLYRYWHKVRHATQT